MVWGKRARSTEVYEDAVEHWQTVFARRSLRVVSLDDLSYRIKRHLRKKLDLDKYDSGFKSWGRPGDNLAIRLVDDTCPYTFNCMGEALHTEFWKYARRNCRGKVVYTMDTHWTTGPVTEFYFIVATVRCSDPQDAFILKLRFG